jgi:hypothetical protein
MLFRRLLIVGEVKTLEILEKIHREWEAKSRMGDDVSQATRYKTSGGNEALISRCRLWWFRAWRTGME